MISFIILFLSIISGVLLDCGCGNLKREDKSINDLNFLEDEKVCQLKTKNKYYRDYYPEESENEHVYKEMSFITGGKYFIGTNEPHFHSDGEGPERAVYLKDFYMDKYEVSNRKFQEFVDSTNYKTEAEHYGDSFIFKLLLSPEMQLKHKDFRVASAPWWYKVEGVSWRHPNGPESSLEGLWDHPVVHVSWHDAVAFCTWKGKRLPNEEEWEVACRGGKKRKLFPWGNKLMPQNIHWLNVWQGEFPDNNTKEDKFSTTCPVDTFRQNEFDMYNIVGNVWEWTESLWTKQDVSKNPNRVKKGGSYLCHESYCYRYRCAARSQNTADSSAGNLGFRCAKDI